MTARWRPGTHGNRKPQITQITQIFFLRVPLCNFMANFLAEGGRRIIMNLMRLKSLF
jgi:hypothetical protein